MGDFFGMAALVTAAFGGIATLVIAVATLVATLKGNREIVHTREAVNGRLDQLVTDAANRAYLLGFLAGEVHQGKVSTKADWQPAFPPSPGTMPPPDSPQPGKGESK